MGKRAPARPSKPHRDADDVGRIWSVGAGPALKGTAITVQAVWNVYHRKLDMPATLKEFPALREVDVLVAIAFHRGWLAGLTSGAQRVQAAFAKHAAKALVAPHGR